MSSHEDQARALAERIARRIAQNKDDAHASRSQVDAGEVGTELAQMRASLSELQQKLAHIESHLTRDERARREDSHNALPRRPQDGNAHDESNDPKATPVIRSPWLSGMYVPATSHP